MGTICYDLEEKVYGTQEIRISQKIKELLCEHPEFYCVILDGAKPESDMQWCLDRYSSRVIPLLRQFSGAGFDNIFCTSCAGGQFSPYILCIFLSLP